MKRADRSLELDFARKLATHHGVANVDKLSLLDLIIRLGELLEASRRRIFPAEEKHFDYHPPTADSR